MNRRWAPPLFAAGLVAVAAAVAAGYVFDGAGRPALGFWAAVWGLVTFLVGSALGLLMRAERPAPRRLAKGTLGLTLGAVAYGALWFAISGRTPLVSPEGAWLWPLGIGSLVGALWALRGAIARRP